MKRDQCLASAKRILLHDARAIAAFREELVLLYRLEQEGHTTACATLMIWDAKECVCKTTP